VLFSRSAISRESLSGDEERSGDSDSGDDRGGVSSSAASTHRTRFDGLRGRNSVRLMQSDHAEMRNSLVIIVCLLTSTARSAKVAVATIQVHLIRLVDQLRCRWRRLLYRFQCDQIV
jgi:hypothetical protein